MSRKSKQTNWVNPVVSLTWFIFGTALLVGVLLSGLLIVQLSNERLQTYKLLNDSRAAQTHALDEYSRLLIERGHLISYREVTQYVADSEQMEYAAKFEVLETDPTQ